MGNASLKEQLQALTLEIPKEAPKKKVFKKNNPVASTKENKKTLKPKPAWLEYVQYGVELLKVHFPACFKEQKNIQPLKIGIKQDLAKGLGTREDIVIPDKACMINSLSYYVNSIAYHKSVTEGTMRIDLNGNPEGAVTAEEARYSLERWQAKLNKKKSKAIVKAPTPSPSMEKSIAE